MKKKKVSDKMNKQMGKSLAEEKAKAKEVKKVAPRKEKLMCEGKKK
jgi:hypothetical protein